MSSSFTQGGAPKSDAPLIRSNSESDDSSTDNIVLADLAEKDEKEENIGKENGKENASQHTTNGTIRQRDKIVLRARILFLTHPTLCSLVSCSN
jgi:hypothetical protein